MSDTINYKPDALAIQEQAELQASYLVTEIELKSNVAPVTFLKNNYENKKIRDRINEPNFRVLRNVLLTKIIGLSGVKEKVDDFTKQDIAKMLLSAYGELTLEEINKAFELERYGLYEIKTEHYGLFDANYVSAIIKKYKGWKLNIKHAHNISPNINNALPQMTEDAKNQIVIDGIIRRFEEFKETKTIDEPCAFVFDFLYERKLFPDDMPYTAIYSLAKRDIESELKNNISTSKSEAQAIREALEAINDSGNEKVLARSKKLALGRFFNQLVDGKKEISTLFKN